MLSQVPLVCRLIVVCVGLYAIMKMVISAVNQGIDGVVLAGGLSIVAFVIGLFFDVNFFRLKKGGSDEKKETKKP